MITLYGTGQEARDALRDHGSEVSAVMDSMKAPGTFEGFEVLDSPRGLDGEKIVVASMYFGAICERLVSQGVPSADISLYFRGEVKPLDEIADYVGRVQKATHTTEAYFAEKMGDRPNHSDRKAFLEFALSRAPRSGLLLEFGVLDGKSINVFADADERTVHGFDSFEGLPGDWIFGYGEGALSRHGRLPEVRENVHLIPGWFDETLPGFLDKHEGPAALVHLDADLYSSTKYVLDTLSDRIMPGTVLIFDEYLYMNDPDHADFRAFHDWRGDRTYSYLGRAMHRVALVMTS